jgi:hypothetical protein
VKGRKVSGKWNGRRGECDPFDAPYVIAGSGMAPEGFENEATANFALDRRARGCPDLLTLWEKRKNIGYRWVKEKRRVKPGVWEIFDRRLTGHA